MCMVSMTHEKNPSDAVTQNIIIDSIEFEFNGISGESQIPKFNYHFAWMTD